MKEYQLINQRSVIARKLLQLAHRDDYIEITPFELMGTEGLILQELGLHSKILATMNRRLKELSASVNLHFEVNAISRVHAISFNSSGLCFIPLSSKKINFSIQKEHKKIMMQGFAEEHYYFNKDSKTINIENKIKRIIENSTTEMTVRQIKYKMRPLKSEDIDNTLSSMVESEQLKKEEIKIKCQKTFIYTL